MILPVALTTPPVNTLPKIALPATDIALVAELNINPELAPALPLALKITCVFDPGTVKLPVIFPWKVPTNKLAVTFPLVDKLPVVTFPVTLKLVNTPTLVIFG